MPRALALLAILLATSAHASHRPNIVLIIGDDIGWPYHGFADSPQVIQTNAGPVAAHDLAHTPNIDRLAAGGVLFTHGYDSAAVCSPSLQTLLSATGMEPTVWADKLEQIGAAPEIGTLGFRDGGPYQRTLPRELRRYGYVSAEYGKMWEGTYRDAGFDAGTATTYDPALPLSIAGANFGREGWDTATCGSTASSNASCPALAPVRDFLDTTDGRPFFLWFAPALPHQPYTAPELYRSPYAALGLSRQDAGYLANVRWLDEVTGELLAELDSRGLLGNTLVIYLSDNGWGLQMQTVPGQGKGKGTPYDIGFRTPIVFSWPGQIPPAVHHELVHASDVPATILGFVQGAEIPAGSQGRNLEPWLEGGPAMGRDRIITHYAGHQVVDLPWRYIQTEEGLEELYDIEADPFEQQNLAGQFPQVVAELRAAALQGLSQGSQTLAGRMVAQDGTPIVAAQLRVGPAIVSTDSTGWFETPAPGDGSPIGVRPHRRDRDLTWSAGDPLRAVPGAMAGMFLEIQGRRVQGLVQKADGVISGAVVDAASGEPIVGAMVRAKAQSPWSRVQAYTQADGTFRLTGLPASSYLVRVRARGFRKVPVRVTPLPSESVTFALQSR